MKEIVIKIHDTPQNDHERWVLKNGIPHPKGYGRLIDADKLECTYVEEVGLEGQMHCVVRSLVIKEAPAIIEADKTESEE